MTNALLYQLNYLGSSPEIRGVGYACLLDDHPADPTVPLGTLGDWLGNSSLEIDDVGRVRFVPERHS